MDLVFYLKDETPQKSSDDGQHKIREKYWEYALPAIQKANNYNGTFSGSKPTTSNTLYGYFGIGGFNTYCVANNDGARTGMWLASGDTNKNKGALICCTPTKKKLSIALENQ